MHLWDYFTIMYIVLFYDTHFSLAYNKIKIFKVVIVNYCETSFYHFFLLYL